MNDRDCRQIDDILIDFCDGDLSPSRSARVKAHLSECAACRTRVEQLKRSLTLAREIWQASAETAREVKRSPDAVTRRPKQRRFVLAGSLAAAVFIVVLAWQFGSSAWNRNGQSANSASDRSIAGSTEQTTEQTTQERKTPKPLVADDSQHTGSIVADDAASTEELLGMIERAGRRARLEASLALLSSEPALEPFARQAKDYLTTAYGEPGSTELSLPSNHPLP